MLKRLVALRLTDTALALASILLVFLVLVGGYSYGKSVLLNGNYFLNIKEFTVDDAALGEPVNITFCREPRISVIQTENNTRIIEKQENGIFTEAFSYQFSAPVQQEGDSCHLLTLANPVTGENRQPQEPGIYRVRTVFRFNSGHDNETAEVVSNEYRYGL